MNMIKKIALLVAVIAAVPVHAGMISLDSMLNGRRDEVSIRKVLFEAVMKYGKVVLYFGAEWCGACRSTKTAILELLSQFPDVMFVLVDLTKYPSLKTGSIPKIRFHKNGAFLQETGSLSKVRLKALLNQYYH